MPSGGTDGEGQRGRAGEVRRPGQGRRGRRRDAPPDARADRLPEDDGEAAARGLRGVRRRGLQRSAGAGIVQGPEAMSEWHPMETAPKDGSWILLRGGEITMPEWHEPLPPVVVA